MPLLEKTPSDPSHETLEELLRENLALSEKIYTQNKKIKRYIVAHAVGSWLRLLLIVVPLILAAIYLPPLLKPYFEQAETILNLSGQMNAGGFEKFLREFER